MKFLIQTINKKVVHDFSFTLLESIRYINWLYNSNDYKYKLVEKVDYNNIDKLKYYIPIGTVEFVSEFIKNVHNKEVKPWNVPQCLFNFAHRKIINGTKEDIKDLCFVKSNDRIKAKLFDPETNKHVDLTGIYNNNICFDEGNYQISELIQIDSEWRCFVYQNKLVGLQNYGGDFTLFPNVDVILSMINKFENQPIAYTLDVGVNERGTFVIEVHDFFSCGLYGFANHKIYINMLTRWFWNYVKK